MRCRGTRSQMLPAAAQASGVIDVFWKATNASVKHNWYMSGWNGPRQMGSIPVAGEPSATTSSPGVVVSPPNRAARSPEPATPANCLSRTRDPPGTLIRAAGKWPRSTSGRPGCGGGCPCGSGRRGDHNQLGCLLRI